MMLEKKCTIPCSVVECQWLMANFEFSSLFEKSSTFRTNVPPVSAGAKKGEVE